MPVFSTWMMQVLGSNFKFNQGLLCKAYKELYSDQLVVVCNIKPIMGELEFKIEKKPKPILFFKVLID